MGTNGWFDSDTGNTVSILVEGTEYDIVLDAGFGIAKLSRCSTGEKPVYLFISHLHLDHIAGMHTLALNKFTKGLFIMVQENDAPLLQRIMSVPYTLPLETLPFSSTVLQVPRRANELPFRATFLPMEHAVHTLGVRLEIDDRVIAYCPDTGYCNNAVTLARNADLLIAECAYLPQESNAGWPHLNPETAARVAREANAKRLALTHFDAQRYETLRERQQAQDKAAEIFPHTFMTTDGLSLVV